MLKSILNVKNAKQISKKDQKEVLGGAMAIDDGFDCYCNGTYVGKKNSIQECWDAC